MARKRSKCLVIDACVARSAGGMDTTDPGAKNCRDFLTAILDICHHVVMTRAIGEEWKMHQSRFARKWLLSMEAHRKVRRFTQTSRLEMRERIMKAIPDKNNRDAMLKDVHLLEAALSADKIIASTDQEARTLFTKSAGVSKAAKNVVWLDPGKEGEKVLDRLKKGRFK